MPDTTRPTAHGAASGPASPPRAAAPPITIRPDCGAEEAERGLSGMARGLVGSEILKIAASVRALLAAGKEVCNLTVGDFASKQFPIPRKLAEETRAAIDAGETNYPPADGVMELRKAIQGEYERRLGLSYPIESILVASGARPVIYAAYLAVLDAGETVAYPTPSWNNNHYAHLVGAEVVEIPTTVETHFLPTAAAVEGVIGKARLLVLNTPLNPTGTVMRPEEVRALGELLVRENGRRKSKGERPVYLLYDQVYRSLTFRGVRHDTPVHLVPECAPWVIFVDAISKAFCATGLRVGWTVGPAPVVSRMRDIIAHVGAWGPRPEQVASARLLADVATVDAFHEEMLQQVSLRLEALFAGVARLRERGFPLSAIEPQGAIYLSVRFDLFEKRNPATGRPFASNEEIRAFLLEKAGFAVVPFQAFGVAGETGWFRLSVGAVSVAEIEAAFGRLEQALAALH